METLTFMDLFIYHWVPVRIKFIIRAMYWEIYFLLLSLWIFTWRVLRFWYKNAEIKNSYYFSCQFLQFEAPRATRDRELLNEFVVWAVAVRSKEQSLWGYVAKLTVKCRLVRVMIVVVFGTVYMAISIRI